MDAGLPGDDSGNKHYGFLVPVSRGVTPAQVLGVLSLVALIIVSLSIYRHHLQRTRRTRPERFDLLQAGCRGELQLGVRLALPKAPERIRDDAAPRCVFREADAHPDDRAPRGRREQPLRSPEEMRRASSRNSRPGGAQLHAARQPIEQLEPQLGFQILNLGQSRLGDIQPRGRAPVVFLFPDSHEISEMPQFHTDI